MVFYTLEQVPVATVKTATESHMHQLRQRAQEHSIVLYEADIRVADRYLMERFVYGAVEFVAPQVVDDTSQIVIENAQIRPCHFSNFFYIR